MAGVRLGGLWFKKDANGKKYLEGPFGMGLLRVYLNDNKSAETAPDAALFVVEKPQPPKPGDKPHPYAPQRPKPKITPRDQGPEPEDYGF